MLYEDPLLYFRGLTIYRDFSDQNTFYFLPPEAPRIARSAEGGESGDYALRLVLFRPDPNLPLPEGMEDGGGFLNLDVDLHVTEALLEEVREEVTRRFGGQANLVPVPFMSGSVELVLLGVSRDDEGQPFVRKVAGSTVPSLYGTQRAAFSTVLDRHGAALMKQVIEEGGVTMALAIYHLTYAAIPPAYNLKITIDYERVYEKLDLRLNAGVTVGSGQSSFVGKAGFHLLMEELRESRAILVEEVDPIPGENGRTATNQQMINEIIGNLMGSKWFKPTLSQVAQMTNLGGSGGTSTSSASPSPASTSSSAASTTPTSSSSASPSSAAAGTAAAAGQRPNATWHEDSKTPTPFPAGRGVEEPFRASTSGTSETLVVRGDGATAKAGPRADSLRPVALQGNRLVVDVPAGQTRHVEITWPENQGTPETFHLFFDYERPRDANDVRGYSSGTPNPDEPIPNRGEGARFLPESRAPSSPATERGPSALQAWLRTVGRNLKLAAHASFERDNLPAKQTSNQALSNRRLQVAQALIPNDRVVDTSGVLGARGHRDAMAGTVPSLQGDNAPANSRGGKPQDRVALITGQKGVQPPSVLRGHLTRGSSPSSSSSSHSGSSSSSSSSSTSTSSSSSSSGQPTTVQASFEVNLEMIQREERITATYELNSRKARTHEVHPQGQLILDAFNPSDYIIEADGAIDFFQWLDIAATTTAQWELDGIDSIQIQLRYGPRDDGEFIRFGDLTLTAAQESDSWRTGVLRENNDDDLPPVYWYEYKVTVHYLPDVAMGDQQGAMTSVGVPGADDQGWIRSTERNLVIHPRDVTPAVTVNIASGIMRFDLLERAQLVLGYGPYRQNLVLSAETPTHRLVIRPEEGLEDAMLTTEGTLFYSDGAQVPLPLQEWSPQELIVINEPRENVLRVQLILADPANEYERVSVRLRYEHENRVVEETRELTDHAQLEEWAVRLEDPEHRDWQYQATLIKSSGDIDTIDWTDGETEQLILGEPAVDVIPVQVTWLLPPPAGDLLAVKIDLLYEDERNGIRWDHSELIRGEHPGDFTWSIPIRDPSVRSYQYRVTEFRATGAQEGQWQESSERTLVLVPGS